MARDDSVDGEGWISDESSFYGDDAAKAELEQQCLRELTLPCRPFAHNPIDFPTNLPKEDVAGKPTSVQETKQALKRSDDSRNRAPAKKAKTGDSPFMESDQVHSFLKSRPQIAKMEQSSKADKKLPEKGLPRTVHGDEAADLLHHDRFKDDPAAWQQTETVDDFLKRLPVADPNTAEVGPWLWVSNPQTSWSQKQHERKENIHSFIEKGGELLDAFIRQRSRTEGENPGKAVATITRKMGPYRDQLEEDLLRAAVDTGTTCGKWMLFPSSSDLARTWRTVVEATAEGKLGPVSKVGTYDPYDGKDETLICVYTYNFADLDDVRRVLEELVEPGLVTHDGKPVYYKCDAYTYLNITSNNDYKLRASLFSSKEVLAKEAKALKDGVIARLKKRNGTIDSFLS